MPPAPRQPDPRALAARALANVFGGQSLNQALPPALERVDAKDRALLQQLCYGTLRHAPRLLALLQRLLDKPLRKKDADVQALLLIGLYQIDYTRVPAHAAVAATVEATRRLKKNWASGMANAVLRRYQREGEALAASLDTAAALSHPRWLFDRIGQQWPGQRDAIIAANNEEPPMTLRVNASKTDRDQYLAELHEQGIQGTACRYSAVGITLAQPCDVRELPGFAAGLVSVQDEAAQLAAPLLAAAPGDRVLDACAAPGGKACHVLERQPQLSGLVAMDVEEARLARVRDNLARLQLHASVVCGDAGTPPEALAGERFDRILVDAPCSASGVIRRHPDVKTLRRAADLESLATQQLRILTGLWPLLQPGGVLLYVTCSIFNEENDDVVQRFMAQQADAREQALGVDWGEATRHGRQVLPDRSGPDGLYFALLAKAT
jgi:16S rRNA (cytosine967-C5)-methyltransferase